MPVLLLYAANDTALGPQLVRVHLVAGSLTNLQEKLLAACAAKVLQFPCSSQGFTSQEKWGLAADLSSSSMTAVHAAFSQ